MTKLKVMFDEHNLSYAGMFIERGWDTTLDMEKADLFCFTGGEDVTPLLYHSVRHPMTTSNLQRDYTCVRYFKQALALDVPMVGICRGGQFLNVMSGGTMWQHVDGHAIRGFHTARDTTTGELFDVTSTHHQMMCPSDEAITLLVGDVLNTRREYDTVNNRTHRDDLPDIEALFYSDNTAVCFQPHPEYVRKDHPCQQYFFGLLDEYLL